MNRTIDLDATNWKSAEDFFNAILPAIGASPEHGHNLNALIDSMIFGGMNELNPPYTIVIRNLATIPPPLREHLTLFQRALSQASTAFHQEEGKDVDVQLHLVP